MLRFIVPRVDRRRDEAGIVAVNLALVIAFALFAVIQLSRTTLAVKQIKQRVKTITTEVGPGSNVSRLDEVRILDTVAARAEEILAAAKPLSGQANSILEAARSIDGTVSSIQGNANSINGTAKSINSKLSSLSPVVNGIKGPGGAGGGGVVAINQRVDRILGSVGGIGSDLNEAGVLGSVVSINQHAGDIANAVSTPDVLAIVKGILCAQGVTLLGCP